jgi:hypothetical protein
MRVQREEGVIELSGAERVLRNRIEERIGGDAATRREEWEEWARIRPASMGALMGGVLLGGARRAALSRAVDSYATTATATTTAAATARSGTGTRWLAVSIAGTLRSLGVRCGEQIGAVLL